jgi:hypothetical protein
MEEVRSQIEHFPWILSYDNVQIPFRVFSQRLDNQGEFGNGTAATVYINRKATPLPATANRNLQEKRREGLKNPLNMLDIMDLAAESYPRLQRHIVYQVLRFLLEAPEFNLATYRNKDSAVFEPPPPVNQLPTGRDSITLQYLLGTVDIPEASYEDHSRLIKEWFRQLDMDGLKTQEKIGLKKVIAWVGDQLTVDRLRNLFKFRAEDLNSFDRLDWMLLPFGWLHCEMAYENSFHKQYFGTSNGTGLKQAFDVLERKGLSTTSIKGTFHYNLREALFHIAEAHLHVEWLNVSGANNLAELRDRTPEELKALAETIVQHHASSEALDHMDSKPEHLHDAAKRQTIMWNRDVLQYIVFDQAIKRGDVGIMEDMLPVLLFRFVGGGNSNYSIEILELLQGLHREWPSEIWHVQSFDSL